MNSKPVWKIEKIVLPQHADHAGVMWHGTYFNWPVSYTHLTLPTSHCV